MLPKIHFTTPLRLLFIVCLIIGALHKDMQLICVAGVGWCCMSNVRSWDEIDRLEKRILLLEGEKDGIETE